MSDYVIGYDEDNNPIWGDDDMGPQTEMGPAVQETEYPITQEQHDRAAAEGLGMSYEDYIALSGTGGGETGSDPNYSHEGRNVPVNGLVTDDNQTQAEIDRLTRMAKGESSAGNISPGSNIPAVEKPTNWLEKLGLTKDGVVDWKTVLGLGGSALGIFDAATSGPPKQVKTIAELRSGMTPFDNAGPATNLAPVATGEDRARIYANDMGKPKFAMGGEVEGALTQVFSGPVQGSEGGQSDIIDAKLSPGEYVLDAETVSALGDGNTAAGIAKLDELRQQLRAQKRSTPNGTIPPQAQGPLSYMQQGGI